MLQSRHAIRTVKEYLDTDILLPMPRPWTLAVYSAPNFSGIPAYRWTIPFREMQRRGYKADWAHASLMPTWEQENPGQSSAYDIFVIHHVIFDADFAKRMRDAGKLLVGDMDDDYSDRTRGVNTDEILDKMWAQVRRNDAMTVSTKEVKDLIVQYANYPEERVFVCPNLMDLTIWKGWERAPELTIGLSGGESHTNDWTVVPGAVSRILDEYPDVHFFLSGYSPEYLTNLKDRYWSRVHINSAWVPYTEYPGVVAKMDIGLCPVDPSDAFNSKKCVVADTRVSTICGIRKIVDIEPGAYVHTLNGYRKVTDKFHYPESETIRIVTSLGYVLEGSTEHPVLTPDGWASLKSLGIDGEISLSQMPFGNEFQVVPFNCWAVRRDDTKAVNVATESCPLVRIDENYGLLIGAILGDGNVTPLSTRITCDERDADFINMLVDISAKIGISAKVRKHSGNAKCADVHINAKRFNEFLAYIDIWGGSSGRQGVHGNEKNFRVPEIIWKSPKSVVRSFLAALLEADAGMGETSITFCTKSEQLAIDVQILLSGFGIVCKRTRMRNKINWRYYHYLYFGRDACDVFEKEIGFLSDRKRASLSRITSKEHSNAFRTMQWKDSVETIEHRTNDVYDITVDGEHHYLSNSMISHNSPIKSLELMCSGGVPVCSDTNVYRDVITHGDNGLLVEHSENGFYWGIKEAIDQRERMVRLGGEYVKANWDVRKRYIEWRSAYEQIATLPTRNTI